MKIRFVSSIPMTDLESAVMTAGFKAIAAQRERLTAKGILDQDGKLIDRTLPPDMREDSETEV